MHFYAIVLINLASNGPKHHEKKKGLIMKRFLNFRHFGRLRSPDSDLSDGQAGTNCETF